MKYVINNNIFKTSSEATLYILDHMNNKKFDKMLDRKYGEIEIFGKYYDISYIFYKVDKDSYDRQKKIFYHELYDEVENVIECMNEFNNVNVYGINVYCVP